MMPRCRSCCAEAAATRRASPEYQAYVRRQSKKEPDRTGVKRCSSCKVDRPRMEFFRCAANRDGLINWCRFCQRDRKAFRYRENAEFRAHTQRLSRESKRRRYATSEKYREAIKKEKRGPAGKARQAVKNAVLFRRLLKPACCEKCGRSGTGREIQGHHYLGYEPAHHLDVLWLCVLCHAEAHR